MMKRLAAAVVLCGMLAAGNLAAQDGIKKKGRGKLWWASVAALVGASLVDAHSSWGRQELNPVLRGSNGQFGFKGVAIKGGIAGGVIAAQSLLLQNNPQASKSMAMANFGMAGVFGGVAMYNHRNHSASPAVRPSYLVADPSGN
ncbi:MAG: hypothetical protein KIT09_20790 [Bryobacteraceae bacterium]|nr:hypothetical protein [Bryobacteraceae bacterium]